MKFKITQKHMQMINTFISHLHNLKRYAIGLFMVGLTLWILIQIHNHFSKDNISILDKNKKPDAKPDANSGAKQETKSDAKPEEKKQ